MVTVTKDGYTPATVYVENTKDSLVDLEITDSTELWLMQFPTNLNIDDFDDQEVTLHLHHEGKLGTVEGSSGKVYDLVSFSSQEPDATVFTSCSSESKIAGKITRLVSLVNYPDPSELKNSQKQKVMSLASSSSMKSSRNLPTPSRSMQRGRTVSRGAASTHSSKQKSALSEELGEASKTPKRQKSADSEHFSGGVTSSGSLGTTTHQKKSKSKNKS